MANGDDFDPNPPGTMTGMGLQPNDPLYDWASNMKPSDLAQFVHNPQGAVQSMIDQGKPPPDHHYDQLGNPISADQAAQLDAAREAAKQKLAQGLGVPPQQAASQRFSSEPPPRPEDTAGRPSERRPPPPTQTIPPSGPLAGDEPTLGQPKGPLAPVAEAIKRQISPNAPTTPRPGGAAAPTIVTPAQAQVEAVPGPVPLPQQRPAGVPGAAFEPVTPGPARVATAAEAAEIAARQAAAAQAEKDKKLVAQKEKVEPLSGEAVSDFAKSLQGVKIPERPKLPGVGTPGVRSPVGVTPNVQNLLALAGAPGGLPSTQAAILAKLLGRIG
jgi:hypothetical protein